MTFQIEEEKPGPFSRRVGVTTVKVCGPVHANDTVYVDVSPGKEGCGTTIDPASAAASSGPSIVIGRVLTASAKVWDAAADDENDVLCAISTGGTDEQTAKVGEIEH